MNEGTVFDVLYDLYVVMTSEVWFYSQTLLGWQNTLVRVLKFRGKNLYRWLYDVVLCCQPLRLKKGTLTKNYKTYNFKHRKTQNLEEFFFYFPPTYVPTKMKRLLLPSQFHKSTLATSTKIERFLTRAHIVNMRTQLRLGIKISIE